MQCSRKVTAIFVLQTLYNNNLLCIKAKQGGTAPYILTGEPCSFDLALVD